jgi:hypothetical protein
MYGLPDRLQDVHDSILLRQQELLIVSLVIAEQQIPEVVLA